MPILSLTILLPIATALLLSLLSARQDFYIKTIGISAFAGNLLASIFMLWRLEVSDIGAFEFIEVYNLHPIINYFVGVDAISLLLINLMTFLGLLSAIYTIASIKENVKEFLIALLVLQGVVIGAFASLDLLLFYIFFEISLVPMYFIIAGWGGENKLYASYKFVIYTLVGSCLFIVCIIYLYQQTGTLNILELGTKAALISPNWQKALWMGIFIAFAIKIPMLPLHTWLPDAHVQAPTTGSVLLAGVLLKLGGYGFIRILLPILPDISRQWAIIPVVLSAVAIIYASFVAMAQQDMKKMIAYSSIAHMGYVTASIFSINSLSVKAAVFQMISHGLIAAALFFSVGMLDRRMQTKYISNYGGVAKSMPTFAIFFMFFTLASIGLPGTSGFIGEFLALNAIFAKHHILAAISCFGVVLSTIYMLGLYKAVMLGKIENQKVALLGDLKPYEVFICGSLSSSILLLGIFPDIINNLIVI